MYTRTHIFTSINASLNLHPHIPPNSIFITPLERKPSNLNKLIKPFRLLRLLKTRAVRRIRDPRNQLTRRKRPRRSAGSRNLSRRSLGFGGRSQSRNLLPFCFLPLCFRIILLRTSLFVILEDVRRDSLDGIGFHSRIGADLNARSRVKRAIHVVMPRELEGNVEPDTSNRNLESFCELDVFGARSFIAVRIIYQPPEINLRRFQEKKEGRGMVHLPTTHFLPSLNRRSASLRHFFLSFRVSWLTCPYPTGRSCVWQNDVLPQPGAPTKSTSSGEVEADAIVGGGSARWTCQIEVAR